jgi:hypothetical protein
MGNRQSSSQSKSRSSTPQLKPTRSRNSLAADDTKHRLRSGSNSGSNGRMTRSFIDARLDDEASEENSQRKIIITNLPHSPNQHRRQHG